jgi:hypothetical protein
MTLVLPGFWCINQSTFSKTAAYQTALKKDLDIDGSKYTEQQAHLRGILKWGWENMRVLSGTQLFPNVDTISDLFKDGQSCVA